MPSCAMHRASEKFAGQDPITGYVPELPNGEATNVDVPNANTAVTLAITDKNDAKYTLTGLLEKKVPGVDKYVPQFFVTSRGGEYFFVPSLSTLKTWSQ